MRKVELDRHGYVVAAWLDDDPCPVLDLCSYRARKMNDCKHFIVEMNGGGKTCSHCNMVVAWV